MVIDSECVAWDTETKKILPFQVLSTRSKKDVKEEDIKVKVPSTPNQTKPRPSLCWLPL